MKIKKLKILNLSKAKSFSQQNFFTKIKTPIINKIPFLLNKSPNNASFQHMQNNQIKNKILSLIQRKKSDKNFLNLSRYLNDEPYNKNIKSKIEMKHKNNIRNREEIKFESDSDSMFLNDTPSNNFFRNIRDKSLYEYQKVEDDSSFLQKNILNKKFHKNFLDNNSFKNMIQTSSKINIKNLLNKSNKNKQENNKSDFIRTKLNIISTKNRQKEIKEYEYYNENNKINIKYEKPKIKKFGNKNYEIFNKIFKKRPKKQPRIFSKSLFDIQCENEKYEQKNEKDKKIILIDKIYFNKNNLSSLIKLDKNKKKKIIDDEIIESFNKIKNFNDNEEFILKKLKQHYNPKSAKSNNLSNPKNIKYKGVIRNNI